MKIRGTESDSVHEKSIWILAFFLRYHQRNLWIKADVRDVGKEVINLEDSSAITEMGKNEEWWGKSGGWAWESRVLFHMHNRNQVFSLVSVSTVAQFLPFTHSP